MSRFIIFSAFIAICLSTAITSAQTSGIRLSFSEDTAPSGIQDGGSIVFTGLENPDMRVFEAIIPATTESECFASKDFSAARPVSANRASLGYDSATGSYQLKWTNVRDKRDSCRVLLVRDSISSSDLAMWQSNYGVGGFAEESVSKDGFASVRGDGSVRHIRYSISLNAWPWSTTLEVKYPGKDGDVIQARFPDAPDRNFLLFETVLPVATEAECLASTDFSSAVPADPHRTSVMFDSQSALWQLRSLNTGSVPPCHVLLANGDGVVDAADCCLEDKFRKDSVHGERGRAKRRLNALGCGSRSHAADTNYVCFWPGDERSVNAGSGIRWRSLIAISFRASGTP